jgi:predicted CopG family antitoxin
MGTKTIGVREDVYERLKARKRENESFTDLVDRLLAEAQTDWREGFGTLEADAAEELEQVVETSRTQTSAGLAQRQREVLEELSETEDMDETA